MKGKKILALLLIFLTFTSIFATTITSEEVAANKGFRINNLKKFLDNSYSKLYCVMPSNAAVGQPIKITIQAWDWAERICKKWIKSSITFSSTDIDAILPKDFSFRLIDFGTKTFEDSVTFTTPGIHYIIVNDTKNNIFTVSNPVIVTEKESEYKLYWGEIHSHSTNSDGMGTLDQGYRYARDVSMLDFCTFSDHDFCWNIKEQTIWMNLIGWNKAKRAVKKYNEPGNFVTMLSYEYTNSIGDGHYNVYYNSIEDAPFYSCLDDKSDRVFELWDLFKTWKIETGNEVFTVPHHLIDGSKSWSSDNYDEELVPLVEIFQFRGSSEMLNKHGNPIPYRKIEIDEEGHSVQDALAKGYKVGFCAGSDDHTGHPGHVPYTFSLFTEPLSYVGPFRRIPRGHYNNILRWYLGFSEKLNFFKELFTLEDAIPEVLYPNGGITGVYAKDLTREEIFNSLKDRRCVAVTNCNRMIVDFTVNDKSIGDGSEIYVEDVNTPRIINCSIAGTAPISSITLVKNNKTYFVENGKGIDPLNLSNYKLNFSINDNEPITGIGWDEINNTGGRDFYYIRVIQTSGCAGWVGPIWVNPSL